MEWSLVISGFDEAAIVSERVTTSLRAALACAAWVPPAWVRVADVGAAGLDQAVEDLAGVNGAALELCAPPPRGAGRRLGGTRAGLARRLVGGATTFDLNLTVAVAVPAEAGGASLGRIITSNFTQVATDPARLGSALTAVALGTALAEAGSSTTLADLQMVVTSSTMTLGAPAPAPSRRVNVRAAVEGGSSVAALLGAALLLSATLWFSCTGRAGQWVSSQFPLLRWCLRPAVHKAVARERIAAVATALRRCTTETEAVKTLKAFVAELALPSGPAALTGLAPMLRTLAARRPDDEWTHVVPPPAVAPGGEGPTIAGTTDHPAGFYLQLLEATAAGECAVSRFFAPGSVPPLLRALHAGASSDELLALLRLHPGALVEGVGAADEAIAALTPLELALREGRQAADRPAASVEDTLRILTVMVALAGKRAKEDGAAAAGRMVAQHQPDAHATAAGAGPNTSGGAPPAMSWLSRTVELAVKLRAQLRRLQWRGATRFVYGQQQPRDVIQRAWARAVQCERDSKPVAGKFGHQDSLPHLQLNPHVARAAL